MQFGAMGRRGMDAEAALQRTNSLPDADQTESLVVRWVRFPGVEADPVISYQASHISSGDMYRDLGMRCLRMPYGVPEGLLDYAVKG